jgi:predicted AlkP superfamily pyrophosphatase or phosphodiesterase
LANVFPTTSYPNHISLFTGYYPENHGIISNVFKNPQTGEYFDSRIPESYNNPKWYDAMFFWEYAEKFGIYSSMIFIPGASVSSKYKGSYYFLDQSSRAIPKFRIDDAFTYLHEAEPYKPSLTAVLFDYTDEAGHKYGTFHDQTNEAIIRIDNLVGTIIDSLKQANMYNQTNIIFLSVHGMTDVQDSQTVNIGEMLYERKIQIDNFGSYTFLYCDLDSVSTFKNILNNNPLLHAYAKNEIPDSLHIKHHPFSPDILLIPKYKRIITEKNDFGTYNLKGMHGYPPSNSDMQGLFIASGPSFKSNYKKNKINIIDIYPLLCTIFRIYVPPHIDGNLKNIRDILK